MKKLMIIDTQGEAISDEYRALLPGVKMRGIEMDATRGTPCHPHGAFCGWLAAIPCMAASRDVEIIFVRIFDKDARWIEGCDEWMLDVIAKEEPDCISRSWGAWDGDQKISEMFASVAFDKWIHVFNRLQESIGFADFGAAGNNDSNDADWDVAYPQCQLDFTNVIGACSRDGVACEWSGDGPSVQCVMWAEDVFSPDMAGIFHVWSGTSAATPKAAGCFVALQDTPEQWKNRIMHLQDVSRPEGDWELPHPKWGYGCAEALWQNYARRIHPGLIPMHSPVPIPAMKGISEYHDYRENTRESQRSNKGNRRPDMVAAPEPDRRSPGRRKKAGAYAADQSAGTEQNKAGKAGESE